MAIQKSIVTALATLTTTLVGLSTLITTTSLFPTNRAQALPLSQIAGVSIQSTQARSIERKTPLIDGASILLSSYYLPTTARRNKTFLDSHNIYRATIGVPPLRWSNTLATNAQQWVNHLAAKGGTTIEHSTVQDRPGQGENIWFGTAGYYNYTAMIDSWGKEKQNFTNGTFPNVSTTGNWKNVGHYSQIIWRDTAEVGCAIATAGGNNLLVCRYSSAGNQFGQKVY